MYRISVHEIDGKTRCFPAQEKTVLALREEYKESMRKVLAEKEALEKELEELRVERLNLMKQNLELSGTFEKTEAEEQTTYVPDSGIYAEKPEAEEGTTFPETDAMDPNADETEGILTEELTARVLKRYMEKNTDSWNEKSISDYFKVCYNS